MFKRRRRANVLSFTVALYLLLAGSALNSLSGLIGSTSPAGGISVQGGSIVVQSENSALAFSKTSGSLTSITNLLTGQNTILKNDYPLWTISTTNGTYSSTTDSPTFMYKILSEYLALQWDVENKFLVLVMVKLDAINGGVDLSINATNFTNLTINSIEFPYIAGFVSLSNSSGSDTLLVPYRDGLIIPDFQEALSQTQTIRWEYTGSLSMQFFLLYDNLIGGLYEGAQDPSSSYKALEIQNFTFASPAFKLYWELYPPEIEPGNQFVMNYSISIASFRGAGWEDGAVLYRAWATSQQYVSRGTLLNRTDVPNWFKDIGLVDPTSPPSNELPYTAQNLAQAFPNDTALLDLWSWDLHGFDSGYGNYFPPAGGGSALINATNALHQLGDFITLFFSGVLVDTNSSANPGFPSEEKYLIVNEGGELYTQDESNGAVMAEPDPTSTFWQNQLVNYSEMAVGVYGADGVYLDGLADQPVNLNYRNSSSPTLSGSTFWQAYAEILVNMSSAMEKYNPSAIITAEGESEVYIPYLSGFWDNMDQDNPSHSGIVGAVEIPAFSFIYHQYALTYGTPYAYEPVGSTFGSSQLFRYTLSKALAYGLVIRPDLPPYIQVAPNDTSFMLEAIQTEQEYSGYLRFGQMLISPRVTVETTTNLFGSSDTETVPAVSLGFFQADNGSKLMVISNPTTQPQNLTLQFYNGEFGPQEQIESVSICEAGVPQNCSRTNSNDSVSLEVNSESDLLLRVVTSLAVVNSTTTSPITSSSTSQTTGVLTSFNSTSTSVQIYVAGYVGYVVPVLGAVLIAGAGVLAYRARRKRG
jgi:hypothetical protein